MILHLILTLAAGAPASAPVPTVPVETLVTAADYPEAARVRRLAGTMRVALDVGASGRVVRCRRLASTGTAILDAATCRLLLARAQFQPTRDADGKAVAGTYETSVSWPRPAR